MWSHGTVNGWSSLGATGASPTASTKPNFLLTKSGAAGVKTIGMELASGEQEQLAQRRIQAKIAAEDVQKLASYIRRASRAELVSRDGVRTVVQEGPVHAAHGACGYRSSCEQLARGLPGRLRPSIKPGRAGCVHLCSQVGKRTGPLQRPLTGSNVVLGALLRAHLPAFTDCVMLVERKYKLRRSAAIDFLLGQLSGTGTETLPPMVAALATKFAALCAGVSISLHMKGGRHHGNLNTIYFCMHASKFKYQHFHKSCLLRLLVTMLFFNDEWCTCASA